MPGAMSPCSTSFGTACSPAARPPSGGPMARALADPQVPHGARTAAEASRHLLAAIRVLSRLQRGAEMLRAARHERATVGPDWLQTLVPLAWSGRYGKRLEDPRLPRAQAACDA
jgi:hypothetical protein